jgi:hypothetical protein
MKRTAGVVFALVMVWSASAQAPAQSVRPERAVTVCIATNIPTYRAEKVTTQIFSTIGVTLRWVRSRDCPDEAPRISITDSTPPTLLPGALAYARPYEGSEIRIFLDRVMAASDYPQKLCGSILGHVMAHEIAHMLQGVSRHSSEGVMKGKWTRADFSEMRVKLLPFAGLDVLLIHNGLDTRAARASSAPTQ